MFCKNCGKNIPEGVDFCPECGAKVEAGKTVQERAAGNGKQVVETNRSLITYILLTLITCGFYSLYFKYKLAIDVNIICEGDGKETAGLLKLILLSLVTCGIYAWIWDYSLGNRLAENAPRYGLQFHENGTSVLLWEIFGIVLCGVGPFVAMNIIINNMNALANAYNAK